MAGRCVVYSTCDREYCGGDGERLRCGGGVGRLSCRSMENEMDGDAEPSSAPCRKMGSDMTGGGDSERMRCGGGVRRFSCWKTESGIVGTSELYLLSLLAEYKIERAVNMGVCSEGADGLGGGEAGR